MVDILVTVGVILVLIALTAMLLRLIDRHHARDVATAHYEPFHPGKPPPAPQDGDEGGRGRR
jgi:hypothetical protein